MATYYCDLDAASFVDRSGADSTTNVLTGIGGLQQLIYGQGAISTPLAAGDTVYIKGTYTLSRYVKIDCNGKDCTGWTIGADVQDLDNGGASWTGKLVATNAPIGGVYPMGASPGADDIITVELTAGLTAADVVVAEGIDNTTDTDTQDPLASVGANAMYVNRSGSGAAYIKYIGVNSSWSEDGSCFTIDGGASGTIPGHLWDHRGSYTLFRNMVLRRAATRNLYCSGTNTDFCIFYRCIFELAGNDGTYVGNLRYPTYEQCQWLNNTDKGQEYGHYSSKYFFCYFSGNWANLYSISQSGLLYGCLFDNSTNLSVDVKVSGCQVYNCVFNDAGTIGFNVNATGYHTLIGNRFTNNTTYGIYGSVSSESSWEDFNVFYNNGTNYSNIFQHGGNSLVATNTTEEGYTDKANEDYNLTTDAILRSTPLILNWTP